MKPIRDYLNEISQSQNPDEAVKRHAYGGFTESDKERYRAAGLAPYAGKVRELIRKKDELFIFHSDRLSAFDRYVGMVPYKGTILADISEFWLRSAQKVVPTHLLGRPHERILQCISCEPYKVEVIVRGYMAGSMQRAYDKGVREFCGSKLQEGLKANRALPQAIITPTTKAAAYEHDEDVSPAELIERGVCTAAEWEEISTMALRLFQYGQEVYAERGWILVDTKYEFGRDAKGQIRVIDEIHTPDSSRLWVRDSYEARVSKGEAPEMLDKENVRRYLMGLGFSGHGDVPRVPVEQLVDLAKTYLFVAEKLRGESLLSEGPEHRFPDL